MSETKVKVPANIVRMINNFKENEKLKTILETEKAKEQEEQMFNAGIAIVKKYYKDSLENIPKFLHRYHVPVMLNVPDDENEKENYYMQIRNYGKGQGSLGGHLLFSIPGLSRIHFFQACWLVEHASYNNDSYYVTPPTYTSSTSWCRWDASLEKALMVAREQYLLYKGYEKEYADLQEKIRLEREEQERKEEERVKVKKLNDEKETAKKQAKEQFLLSFLEANPAALWLLEIFVEISNREWDHQDEIENLNSRLFGLEYGYDSRIQELKETIHNEQLQRQRDLDEKDCKIQDLESDLDNERRKNRGQAW